MTDMTPVSSVIGALKTTTTSDPSVSFKEILLEKLTSMLGDSATVRLRSLVDQLPMVEHYDEIKTAEHYVDSLTLLQAKQVAISGMVTAEAVGDWMLAIQSPNSPVKADDVINQVHVTLSNQFRSWFENKLEDFIGRGLPTGFISNFRLGIETTQAEQIAQLNPAELKNKTTQISSFLQELGQPARSRKLDENAAKFVGNAFEEIGKLSSVNIEQLRSADFSLTKERFNSALQQALKEALSPIGNFDNNDIRSLAEKIAWVPGITQNQLKEALSELVKQVEKQFKDSYKSDQVSQELKSQFGQAISDLKDSNTPLTLTSLFSSVSANVVKNQIQQLYAGLHQSQQDFLPESRFEKIKLEAEKDIAILLEKEIEVLFANALTQKQDEKKALEFADRLKEMRTNLGILEARLNQITENEKTAIIGDDGETQYKVKPEHLLSEKDLLSVIKASISGHFDERILLAYEHHRLNRFEKREKQKQELEALTARLKIFSEVQSQVQKMQSKGDLDDDDKKFGEPYNPTEYSFSYADFKYKDKKEFYESSEFKQLSEVYREKMNFGPPGDTEPTQKIPLDDKYFNAQASQYVKDNFVPTTDNIKKFIKPEYQHPDGGIKPDNQDVSVSHFDFLDYESVKVEAKDYQDDKDVKKLANLASQMSDRTKLLNSDVQFQTNELNETNGQYNSTIEAMTKFVQKYISIIESLLRNF